MLRKNIYSIFYIHLRLCTGSISSDNHNWCPICHFWNHFQTLQVAASGVTSGNCSDTGSPGGYAAHQLWAMFNFSFSVFGKKSQIIGFWSKLRGLRPRLENPESAADICFQFYTVSDKKMAKTKGWCPLLIQISTDFYYTIFLFSSPNNRNDEFSVGGMGERGGSKINSMLCHFEWWIQGFPNEGSPQML